MSISFAILVWLASLIFSHRLSLITLVIARKIVGEKFYHIILVYHDADTNVALV